VFTIIAFFLNNFWQHSVYPIFDLCVTVGRTYCMHANTLNSFVISFHVEVEEKVFEF